MGGSHAQDLQSVQSHPGLLMKACNGDNNSESLTISEGTDPVQSLSQAMLLNLALPFKVALLFSSLRCDICDSDLAPGHPAVGLEPSSILF